MRILVSWSTGKDSSWMLHCLQKEGVHEIVGLLTTVTDTFKRVSMHGTREALLDRQAKLLSIPIWRVTLQYPSSNEAYQQAFEKVFSRAAEEKVEAIAFGDLYLNDVRKYREEQLAGSGIKPLFPLWGRCTKELSQAMISGGLKARIVCLDSKKLNPKFAGKEYDGKFLEEIPEDIDPCGENGEFHTFVYDGPMFSSRIPISNGEVVERGGFIYQDIMLEEVVK